jgi:hypothetical protein
VPVRIMTNCTIAERPERLVVNLPTLLPCVLGIQTHVQPSTVLPFYVMSLFAAIVQSVQLLALPVATTATCHRNLR